MNPLWDLWICISVFVQLSGDIWNLLPRGPQKPRFIGDFRGKNINKKNDNFIFLNWPSSPPLRTLQLKLTFFVESTFMVMNWYSKNMYKILVFDRGFSQIPHLSRAMLPCPRAFVLASARRFTPLSGLCSVPHARRTGPCRFQNPVWVSRIWLKIP